MGFTPYRAATIVNAILSEKDIVYTETAKGHKAGDPKVLPTQMFYNYTTARLRQGKTSFIEVDNEGRITEEGLQKWLSNYLVKQVSAKEFDELQKAKSKK
jgi:hypothetical protein